MDLNAPLHKATKDFFLTKNKVKADYFALKKETFFFLFNEVKIMIITEFAKIIFYVKTRNLQ